MSDGFGQAPKKETVYGGPAPAMDNQQFANPSAPGTTGTVYSGPTPGQGTVYGGTPSATTAARSPMAGGVNPAVLKSANYFFYIAVLSLIYSLLALSGVRKYPVVGMGVTLLAGPIAGIFAAGVMALFGFFARQGQKWAFLVGMVIYGLDGVALFTSGIFLGVAFHGLILFFIFRGFMQLD